MTRHVTEIGRELRKLRAAKDERLKDMALKLGKSSSFISAVEVGKKPPPRKFIGLVAQTYKLSKSAETRLQNAAVRSRELFYRGMNI